MRSALSLICVALVFVIGIGEASACSRCPIGIWVWHATDAAPTNVRLRVGGFDWIGTKQVLAEGSPVAGEWIEGYGGSLVFVPDEDLRPETDHIVEIEGQPGGSLSFPFRTGSGRDDVPPRAPIVETVSCTHSRCDEQACCGPYDGFFAYIRATSDEPGEMLLSAEGTDLPLTTFETTAAFPLRGRVFMNGHQCPYDRYPPTSRFIEGKLRVDVHWRDNADNVTDASDSYAFLVKGDCCEVVQVPRGTPLDQLPEPSCPAEPSDAGNTQDQQPGQPAGCGCSASPPTLLPVPLALAVLGLIRRRPGAAVGFVVSQGGASEG